MAWRMLFVCLGLVGCASHQVITPVSTGDHVESRQVTHPVAVFEMQGLLGARTPKKAWSANVIWVQHGPGRYHLRLFGPMGGGTVLIKREQGMVFYQDAHHHLQGKQAQVLLKQQTGVDLPVELLYYWVRGLPAPGGHASAIYDAQKRLMRLNQAGYVVDYTQYQQVKQYMLPVKMKLQGKGLTAKVVVRAWRV